MAWEYWLHMEAESRQGALRTQAERDRVAGRVACQRRPVRIALASALRRLAEVLDGQAGRVCDQRRDPILGES